MKKKSVMSRIMKELAKYLIPICVSLAFAFITVALTLRIPVLIGQAIDCTKGRHYVDYDGLYLILREMVITIVATSISQWIMNRIFNRVTYTVTRNIRDKAFDSCSRLPLSKIDTTSHGDYMSRIVADADTFADGLLLGFSQLFTGVLTIIGTVFYMLRISVPVSIVVIVLTPVSLFVAKFISSKTHKYFDVQAKARGQVTGLVSEMIENQNIVTLFDYKNTAIDRFEVINEELSEAAKKATFYSSLVNPCTRFVNSLIYAGVGVSGALLAISGTVSIGSLTSFLSYASSYAKPFNEITGVVTEFQNAIACARRLYELIDEPAEVDKGTSKLSGVEGAIEFRDVCFSYDKNKPLIENFNLSVKPGQKVAIVGPTGGGKTTLINLIMRFYELDAGEILIDGVDTRRYSKDELRNKIGMVLQETWLMNRSIADNIRVGKPDATDDEVINAAIKSHAHSFIKRLPNGYDTIIDEDNGLLSQGQKQLLCIARVMLNIPPILILDEATSSIDTRSEQRISKAFNEMMKDRTTFVVAHRLSTIKEADVILYVADGHVLEQGDHNFLLSKDGFYATLYKSQWAI